MRAIDKIRNAIHREPWADIYRIAKVTGVTKESIYAHLSYSGDTFKKAKARRVKQLSTMAGFPPLAEHEAKQEDMG